MTLDQFLAILPMIGRDMVRLLILAAVAAVILSPKA